MKSSVTICCVLQCQTVGKETNVAVASIMTWLDTTSHENPLLVLLTRKQKRYVGVPVIHCNIFLIAIAFPGSNHTVFVCTEKYTIPTKKLCSKKIC